MYRGLQTGKGVLNQMYVILIEVEERKEILAAVTVSVTGASASEAAVASRGTSQRSTISEPGMHLGARGDDEEDGFIPLPVRQNTEIDLGLMPLVTGQTFSRFC